MFVLALSLYNTWNRGVFLLCKITNLLIYRFFNNFIVNLFGNAEINLFPFSVFDKGIIIRHLKNGANLHETAVIGETQSGSFFCDMAGAYWVPPCFGYQGGPQQPPAIPPAKSNYRAVTSGQSELLPVK